ncbi:hypothetical protein ENHY17A_440001 [Moraxellaceae bacterium 17A]|nr:hypothetical protein ENHY17A_440001 [Moraxellaceae bacterium 17A]
MCKSLTILVVEDDENVTNSYQRKVQGHNFDPDKEFEFQIDIVSNKNHALEKLSHNDYDGAIIDLDLTGNGGNDTSGIEVIKNIQENSRFPIFIISGTTHNLDDDRRIQNDFYKVVSRDEDFDFIPHCQNSCHPHPNNLNGGKGDNHGTIQCRTQTSNIKQTAIA